jgi:hypothetical protein
MGRLCFVGMPMKVKMLVSIAGNPNPMYGIVKGFSFRPGDEVDLDPVLAGHWIRSGNAAALADEVSPVKRQKKSKEKE